jgi:hypothetical protein
MKIGILKQRLTGHLRRMEWINTEFIDRHGEFVLPHTLLMANVPEDEPCVRME